MSSEFACIDIYETLDKSSALPLTFLRVLTKRRTMAFLLSQWPTMMLQVPIFYGDENENSLLPPSSVPHSTLSNVSITGAAETQEQRDCLVHSRGKNSFDEAETIKRDRDER